MKRRYFKSKVEIALIVDTSIDFIFAGSINDFEMSFFPMYIAIWVKIIIQILLLKKYGKGLAFELDR